MITRDDVEHALTDSLKRIQDCSCDYDPDSLCWYHMDVGQQLDYLKDTVARELTHKLRMKEMKEEAAFKRIHDDPTCL